MNMVTMGERNDSPRSLMDEGKEVYELIKANAYLERALERMCAEADRLRNELEKAKESARELCQKYEQRLTEKKDEIVLATLPQQGNSANEPASQGNPTEALVPTVLECVTINLEGEIEGVYGSKDPSLRVNLLEFLRFKSRQIANGMHLGVFHGMEAYGARDMIAAELRPNGATYVRGTDRDAELQTLIAAGMLCIEAQ